jgi:hypothetical protein
MRPEVSIERVAELRGRQRRIDLRLQRFDLRAGVGLQLLIGCFQLLVLALDLSDLLFENLDFLFVLLLVGLQLLNFQHDPPEGLGLAWGARICWSERGDNTYAPDD